MLRTAFATLVLFVGTLVFGGLVLLAQLVGIPHGPGSIYERAQIQWGRWLLRGAGVTVVRHGGEDLPAGVPHVFVANHISWADIPVTLDVLPPYGFVAKRELETVPLFGAAARAAGVIYIDRENLKAAFGAYEDAASKIRDGKSVLVYPEGTRGDRYALRPFKKGPFVLAIGAGVPIVPVVIHGTIAVSPRGGEYRVSSGVVHVHILEPIPTTGLGYDDRQALAEKARFRMADVLRSVYGVEPALESRATITSVETAPSFST
ncbi:MAG: lysophospholipid acyltransferase family protein [Gemmatimonas sp.]